VLTVKNPDLRPETTVGYNVGFDLRADNGTVFSGDLFDNTIHDTPMTALSRTIELNLREQMEETNKERGWRESGPQRVRMQDVMPVDGFVF